MSNRNVGDNKGNQIFELDAMMDDLAESLQKLMKLTDGGGTWTLEDQDRAVKALKNYQDYVL